MTEKETQKKTEPDTTDESKKTDKNQELSIPKSRFDEVNQKAKEAELRVQELEAKLAQIENEKLKEKEDFKGLAEKLEAENIKLKIEGLKQNLIQEAIISKELHPRLAKLVRGNTEEEIKQSLQEAKVYYQELNESLKKDLTATDEANKGAGTKVSPMTASEWMELYEKNPKEADAILAKLTEQNNQWQR